MTVRCISMAALAAFAVVATFATTAIAGPWGVAPGEYYSELSGSVFSAGTYYDDLEQRQSIGGLYEQRVISSFSEIGWKRHWGIRLGLPLVSRTQRSIAPAGSRTSTGFGDLLFGIKNMGHIGKAPVALQLTWTAPTGTNHVFLPGVNTLPGTNGAAGAGDLYPLGMQSLQADIAVGGSAGTRTYWALQGGYRYRYATIGGRTKSGAVADERVAERRWQDALLGEAELGIWISKSLLVTGTFHGDFPVAQGDLYDGVFTANTGANGPEYETVRMVVGPRFTYRVDEKLDAFAGSWHTPGGRNMLHTDQYYAGIAWKSSKLDRLAGLLGGSKSR
ncbi:MAG: hypothetical protein ABIU54_12045 [Candidatus Eisenbacteria bacterium]